MLGTVEIYRNFGTVEQQQVYREDNLVVDGAGEQIASMLTVSPSISALTDTSSLLDTSNYTIQAISFGKADSAYSKNAHTFLDKNKNILINTESLDVTGVSQGWSHGASPPILVVSANQIPGPFGGTSAAELFFDNSEFHTDPETGLGGNPTIAQTRTNFVSGAPYTFSVFIKASPDTLDDQFFIIALKHKLTGVGNIETTEARLQWKNKKLIISGITNNQFMDNFHIQELDDGWFRIGVTREWGGKDVDTISCRLFPGGYTGPSLSNINNIGSVYLWGAQLELGHYMTSYVKGVDVPPGSPVESRTNSLMSSSLAGDGTEFLIRAAGEVGVSSYTPEGALPLYPSPLDKKLELTSLTDIEKEANINHEVGHNLNVIPYRNQIDSNFTDVSSFHNFAGTILPADHRLSSVGYYMGCYPEGSSTGGSDWVIVSSFDASFISDPDANLIVSGTYKGLFNEASSMDTSGFVGKVYDPNGKVGLTGTEPVSGLVVSSQNDFSSTGEVTYITTIGSGDIGYSNLFGGIYNIGLWTLDNEAILKNGAIPPYSFTPLNNPRKYKLFSKKSFGDNLCKISDSGSNSGALNYQDLTIIWRIRF